MGELPFERSPSEVLVRMDVPLKEARERPISELLKRGIVVIDKPPGPTSHQVSSYVQKILEVKKSGHSGTLDPQVTGVLPVAIDKGTRIVQSLLTAGKEYVCLMHIHRERPEQEVRDAIMSFVGKIKQLPPVKSAVKRQLRYRKIYYIEILEIDGQDVLFRVGCQAGTYVRKLCHDMGRKLGVGAHMAQLRRTKAAGFNESESATLHDLTDAYHYYKQGDEAPLRKILLPLETGVRHLPKVWVHTSALEPLCHGVQLKVPGIVAVSSEIQVDEDVAVMSTSNELVLVGKAKMTSKQMLGEKGQAIKTEQVFMTQKK